VSANRFGGSRRHTWSSGTGRGGSSHENRAEHQTPRLGPGMRRGQNSQLEPAELLPNIPPPTGPVTRVPCVRNPIESKSPSSAVERMP
jgi:hypothetical protein